MEDSLVRTTLGTAEPLLTPPMNCKLLRWIWMRQGSNKIQVYRECSIIQSNKPEEDPFLEL